MKFNNLSLYMLVAHTLMYINIPFIAVNWFIIITLEVSSFWNYNRHFRAYLDLKKH